MVQHKSGDQVETGKRRGGKLVIVNDKMQRGYRYVLAEPVGRNFDPEFKPELTPTDGTAWLGGDCFRRVLRGGSWHFIPGAFLRSAFRNGFFDGNRVDNLGFRVARTLE